MIPGYHDQEKFAHAHRENLLREAEHERLLAQLPKPDHTDLQIFLARSSLISVWRGTVDVLLVELTKIEWLAPSRSNRQPFCSRWRISARRFTH